VHAPLRARLSEALQSFFAAPVEILDCRPCTGGSIHTCYRLQLDNGQSLFLKTGRASLPRIYTCEFNALKAFPRVPGLRIPEPLLASEDFLIMQWLDLQPKPPGWQEALGRGLAQLHLATRRSQYGFPEDNWLGTSLQPNSWQDDWLAFWRDQRLGHQLRLWARQCDSDDGLLAAGYRLLEKLDTWLATLDEPAVLLHGDLWSGNAAADSTGLPVIFDPAAYYGQREAEFGMMRLFGGFGPACEAAYQELWPFSPGSEARIRLYRLYHELNHLNLFGASYYDSCMTTIKSLL
jgi:protein-ribulosamine 3-kinase